MMDENDLQVFINGAAHYFKQVTRVPAEAQTPYLRGSDSVMLDYSAAISISGSQKGSVYFTAGESMLTRIVNGMGDTETTTEILSDLVGEIANTISGNARKALGSNFNISVPSVLKEKSSEIQLPDGIQSYVIPILWEGSKSYLIICLEK